MFEPSKDIHTNLIAIKKYCHFDEQEGVDTGDEEKSYATYIYKGV